MKTILLFSILYCAIAMPAMSELSDADLNEIRLIVNDEITSEITASEDRMKGHINDKIEGVKSSISAFKWVIGILMGVIAILIAAIGIPLSLMAKRNPKDNEQQKQIEELRQELRQELAELKQHPVFSTGAQL